MLECLIIGDTIAHGFAEVRRECRSFTQAGATSSDIRSMFLFGRYVEARTVIISLGNDDTSTVNTRMELRIIRERIKAERVIWIMPIQVAESNNLIRVQGMVRDVAREHGDTILSVPQPLLEGIPSNTAYRKLAEQTR
jgi:hypothetical protein